MKQAEIERRVSGNPETEKEQAKKKKPPKSIPEATDEFIAELKVRFEYGELPPDHWYTHRAVHSLLRKIEAMSVRA
jgi:hypothetical protein